MKKTLIGLFSLLMLGATAATAQDHGRFGGRERAGFGRPGAYERAPPRGGGFAPLPDYARGGYAARGGYGPRAYGVSRNPYGVQNFGMGSAGYGPARPAGLGPGGYRGFTRGQFLPPAYFGGAVVDPRQYHLRRPPNGYGWVTVGPNAYLTQRSTGLILDTAPLY